jgi:23S rRNA-/tRNA-specific pseudouridylate synthase
MDRDDGIVRVILSPEHALEFRGLDVLFEDGDILIVRKPSGLLTVATADEREKTAYFYLRQYLQGSILLHV